MYILRYVDLVPVDYSTTIVYIVRDKVIQNCTKSSPPKFLLFSCFSYLFWQGAALLFDHGKSIYLSLPLVQQGCRCKPTLMTFWHLLHLFFKLFVLTTCWLSILRSQNMLSLSFLLHLRQVAALLLDGGKFLHLLLLLQQGCFSKLSLTTLHHLLHLHFHQTILTYWFLSPFAFFSELIISQVAIDGIHQPVNLVEFSMGSSMKW